MYSHKHKYTNSMPLVFVKNHMGHKNVTNAVFLNTRKAGLKWSLEAHFANYI